MSAGPARRVLRAVPWCLVLVLFTALPFPGLAQEAADDDAIPEDALYRYVNADGVMVIDFSLPPQYADKGYEVLSPSGRLVKRVPPKSEQNRLTEEERRELEERRKDDAYILRSYSSVAEVRRAGERRLASIEREIAVLKANLEEQERREEDLKERAAGYQASGQETPQSIADVLADLAVQRDRTLEQLRDRREQYLQVARRYQHHARRLLELRPELAPDGDAPSERSPAQ